MLIILANQPLSKLKGVFITPENIRYHASFLPHTTTTTDNRIIHIGTGGLHEEVVIRVPLAAPGEVDPYTSIRITVGLKPPGNEDKDIKVGLSDGVNDNFFILTDNLDRPPCRPGPGPLAHDNNLLKTRTRDSQTSQFVLLFEPFHQYGACFTAQEHGYINTGTFPRQLDINKGLDFFVQRNEVDETYDFYYFIVEILNL